VGVRCGVRAEEIVGDEQAAGIRLADGETIAAELVLISTGVRSNSYLARKSGLDVDKGVLVDDTMATSDPHIYAAGDVTEHRGVVYGIWPASYAQGVVAGVNAAGGSSQFPGLPPSHRLKVQGIDLFSIGTFQPPDASYCVVEDKAADTYLRLVVHDGKLVGANLFGDTALAGAVKTYVEQGTQLAEQHELLARFKQFADLCKNLD
jgi:nitrite reductase (NADH) large subunit